MVSVVLIISKQKLPTIKIHLYITDGENDILYSA